MTSLMNSLERNLKQQNLLVHSEFSRDHPVEEVTKLLLAVLVRHLALAHVVTIADKGKESLSFKYLKFPSYQFFFQQCYVLIK